MQLLYTCNCNKHLLITIKIDTSTPCEILISSQRYLQPTSTHLFPLAGRRTAKRATRLSMTMKDNAWDSKPADYLIRSSSPLPYPACMIGVLRILRSGCLLIII